MKSPNRRVRSLTMIAFINSPADLSAERPREPRFRQSRVGDGLRAIELGLQQRHLGVENVGARRDAGPEPVADHTPCLAGAAHGVACRRNGRTARLELARALLHL